MTNNKVNIDFSGRVATISGGANGIGLSAAHRLVAGGASVSLWDIDEQDVGFTLCWGNEGDLAYLHGRIAQEAP